jgi:hypothetical protein
MPWTTDDLVTLSDGTRITRADAAALLRERRERAAVAGSVERLLTAPSGVGVGLHTATPLQLAIARMLDGTPLGDVATHPDVLAGLGLSAPPPVLRPREMVIVAATRSGKSLLTALAAIAATQRVDVSGLKPGEVPRYSVLSLKLDLARVIHGHVVGTVRSSRVLRPLLVGEPTAETVTLRHPSGVPVEIHTTAGAKAGGSLVARWSAGGAFDEAPRMAGEDEAVVNLSDARTSLLDRLLPGAQAMYIGSPWAPFGPVWDWVSTGFGSPSDARVVVRGTGPQLNPVWWTDERIAALRASPDGERAYRVNVLAEFMDPSASLIGARLLDAAVRDGPEELPAEDGASYVAAIDPATRRNAWTLVVWTRRGRRRIVVLARQWQGTPDRPLRPGAVVREIAEVIRPYTRTLHGDQWNADAIREHAMDRGIAYVDHAISASTSADMFLSLAARFEEGTVEIPRNQLLRADLLSVQRVVTRTGVRIGLPRTGDGRHADFAAVLALALDQPCADYVPRLRHDVEAQEERRMRERERQLRRVADGHWSE